MKIYFLFLFYLIFGMGISAVITPWIYPLIETSVSITPDRLLYRFAMLIEIIGIPFFLAFLHLSGKENSGFILARKQAWLTLYKGTFFGALMLSGLTLLLIAVEARPITLLEHFTLFKVFKILIGGVLSGLAVGLIEEFFFRGPLQTGMRRSLPFALTALLSGTFYSLVHFIRPTANVNELYNQDAAFSMLWGGYSHLAEFSQYADSFFALLAAGIFLSMVRERTGNLLWPIGIHAGWVLTIKLTKNLTDTNSDSIWIGFDSITGWMAAIWISLVAIIYWYWSDPKRPHA